MYMNNAPILPFHGVEFLNCLDLKILPLRTTLSLLWYVSVMLLSQNYANPKEMQIKPCQDCIAL